MGNDKRVYKFVVYYFKPKSRRISMVEKATTKPLTELEFKKMIKRDYKDKENFCFDLVSGKIKEFNL